MLAIWYGGTREGARDVALYAAKYNPLTLKWAPVVRVTDRRQTQRDLQRAVRKIGNPTLITDAAGDVWLFYVATSVGGWSTSTVNYMKSHDGGTSWSRAKRLVLSPFFNISTLVKGAPVLMSDGHIGLPFYHELLYYFPEYFSITPDGTIEAKTRITFDGNTLQPIVVPEDAQRATAFFRNGDPLCHEIIAASTSDAGRHWSPGKSIGLPNPNAAIAACRMPDGRMLLVFNNSATDRRNLSLAIRALGQQSWRIIHVFENDPAGKKEYSYPYLVQASDGNYHLVFTYQRQHIKHVVFNAAWVEEMQSCAK